MTLKLVDPLLLFRSESFRRSNMVQDLCKEVGPIFTTTRSDWGSHGHFTTFFGVIVERDYKDKAPEFNDLYVLHELWHRKTLQYRPGRSWLQWSNDLIHSEFESSLMSECFVYLHIKALRRLTFRHEIWVDRFSKGGALQQKMEVAKLDSNPMGSVENLLRGERIRAMSAPSPFDFLEHQIANYARQNMLWCRVWAGPVGKTEGGPFKLDSTTPAFRVVDEHMSHLGWRDSHIEWLDDVSDSSTGIPFYRQAMGFKPIYEQSIQDFGNDVLSR